MYLCNNRVKSQLNGCQDKVDLTKTLVTQVYCDLISAEFPKSVCYLSCPLSL
jgi:hypothetical protein